MLGMVSLQERQWSSWRGVVAARSEAAPQSKDPTPGTNGALLGGEKGSFDSAQDDSGICIMPTCGARSSARRSITDSETPPETAAWADCAA